MSRVVGDKFYASEEKESKCEYCGKIAELRPYGKDGANICFKCSMKDEETAKEMFSKRIESSKIVIVGEPNDFN